MKTRMGLQVINGLGSTSSRLTHPRPVHGEQLRQAMKGALRYHSDTGRTSGGLTVALKATEHRLSNLLDDRLRVARDLHDSVLQSLYAIGLNLKAALRVGSKQTTCAKHSGEQVVAQINHLILEIRSMIRGLEGGTVRKFDLHSELIALRATYEQAGRLQVILDLQLNAIEVLTKEEEREILKIVREALSNCARHANATQATVSIRMRGRRIRVSISDDGVGFTLADDQPRGYGLANMDARAKKLGGTLRVQSKSGQGTHIIAEFSLEPIPGFV